MEKSFRIKVIVVNAGQAVLFKIGHAGHRIEPNLMRFEDGPEAIVIELLDGVILVIVTLGAIHRQAEEGFAGMLNRAVQPGRAIEQVVVPSQEAGGSQVGGIRGSDLIGGEHFLDHAIIALVGIE